jgi:ABC-type glycerol-3-phosphate transport system permease component
MRKILKYTVLILFAIFSLGPFFIILVSAFKTNNEIFSSPFSLPDKWLWSNFITAWKAGGFGQFFWNTIIMVVPAVFLDVVFSMLGGYAFARFNFKGGKIAFGAMILGLTIPAQAIMIPLYNNFVQLKLMDTIPGLVIALVAYHLPFGIFLMRSFFVNSPNNLADAAKIDGCSEYGVFWRIMIPLAKPGILALTAIEFMNMWKAFLLPLIIIQSRSKRVITLALLFFRSAQARQYQLLAAGVLISSIPVILVYLITSKYFEKGLIAGSFR